MNQLLAGKIRRKICQKLKKAGYEYHYNSILSQAFIGEGFYVAHREKVLIDKIKIWAYDKHWAYGGALKQYDFPLSSRLDSKNETKLAVFVVKFTYMKQRYKGFYYSLYHNNGLRVDNEIILFMTNLDYFVFTDMYDTDAKIIKKLYFQDIGSLDDIYPLVDEYYIKKKQNKSKQYKETIEASFYGMFAKKLYCDKFRSKNDRMRFEAAYSNTGDKEIRCEQVPIAMFQSAYMRYEEWKLFKKYMKHVVYMNTDSIYATKPLAIKCKNEIGHYDIEYDGMEIHFVRRSVYIIFNKDGSIYKSVLSGIIDENSGGKKLTPKLAQKLMDGESITLSTRNKEREIVPVKLQPLYYMIAHGLAIDRYD